MQEVIFLYDLSLPLLLSELLLPPLPFNGDSGEGCVDEVNGELIILNHYDIGPMTPRRRPSLAFGCLWPQNQ